MKQKLRKLFTSTFQVSACTFGGGFVIVPLMRKKFVEELGWIGEQEMLDMTAIAQSSPGPIAVNAAILVGYHIAGIAGAVTAILGTILPPLIIISVISSFYRQFRDNAIVSMAMAGTLAGVAAVLCDVVINMIRNILRRKKLLHLLMLPAAFLAVHCFQVNIAVVIAICGVIGAADTLMRGKERVGS